MIKLLQSIVDGFFAALQWLIVCGTILLIYLIHTGIVPI
jgi:hypothetical protein